MTFYLNRHSCAALVGEADEQESILAINPWPRGIHVLDNKESFVATRLSRRPEIPDVATLLRNDVFPLSSFLRRVETACEG